MFKILLVPFIDAARQLSIPEKTARNWNYLGKFPVPTFRIGSKRMVRASDIEAFVAGLATNICPSNLSPVEVPKDTALIRPRGRPRKTHVAAGCVQPTLATKTIQAGQAGLSTLT